MDKIESASITHSGPLDIQVCVPHDWTDDQVREFAENEHPCGTTHGWEIRRQGHRLLAGADERTPCGCLQNNVHIMLDA